jgi:hypothetical protein
MHAADYNPVKGACLKNPGSWHFFRLLGAFFWIPAFAGMTIMKFISDRYHRRHTRSDRYHRRHTREGGYPVFKTTFYDSILFEIWIL